MLAYFELVNMIIIYSFLVFLVFFFSLDVLYMGLVYDFELIIIILWVNSIFMKTLYMYQGMLPFLPIFMIDLSCLARFLRCLVLVSWFGWKAYCVSWDYCLWSNSLVLWKRLTCYYGTFLSFPWLLIPWVCMDYLSVSWLWFHFGFDIFLDSWYPLIYMSIVIDTLIWLVETCFRA